jgi:hypothetical protein
MKTHLAFGRTWVAALTSAGFLGLFAGNALASTLAINPGALWPDNRGQHIQAHGGGIIKLGDTYYWFGEDRTRGLEPDLRYVSCYSSRDLAQWSFRRQVVKLADPENLGRRWVLERPKVFYNAKAKKYVMYAHIDGKGGYKFASVAVFTCDQGRIKPPSLIRHHGGLNDYSGHSLAPRISLADA